MSGQGSAWEGIQASVYLKDHGCPTLPPSPPADGDSILGWSLSRFPLIHGRQWPQAYFKSCTSIPRGELRVVVENSSWISWSEPIRNLWQELKEYLRWEVNRRPHWRYSSILEYCQPSKVCQVHQTFTKGYPQSYRTGGSCHRLLTCVLSNICLCCWCLAFTVLICPCLQCNMQRYWHNSTYAVSYTEYTCKNHESTNVSGWVCMLLKFLGNKSVL